MKKLILLVASLFCINGIFPDAPVHDPCSSPEKPMHKVQNCRCYNVITYAEFLYWKFTSPSLVFGRDGVGLTNAASPAEVAVTRTGTSFSPKYKYDPGFRVGLALAFGPSKAFDFALRYTWFYTNPKRTVDEFSPSFLPINWLTAQSLTSPTYHKASIAVNLHYNYPEMQLGYSFKVNPYLTLRPYMALSSIIIDGDLRAKYDYTTTALTAVEATTKGESFSWSIGPKIGFDFTARPIQQFSVFCGVNFTQQCAQITMRTEETQNFPATSTQRIIQKGKLSEIRSVPLFGFEIGPVWDTWFCQDQYHFQLRPVWQVSTLGGGNLSFLNNNDFDVAIGAELRGLNVRALLEF